MAVVTIKYYIILITFTIMGSVGGYFFKRAADSKSLKDLIFNKFLYIGGSLYFLSALLNIYVLKYMDYTVVLPLTSITYIWTLFISKKLLNEKIGRLKIGGVVFIILGVTSIIT